MRSDLKAAQDDQLVLGDYDWALHQPKQIDTVVSGKTGVRYCGAGRRYKSKARMIGLVKLLLKILGFTAVFVLCGCASVLDEDGALAMTPYDIQDSGRIVIDAQVNGLGPFRFALDTGASISTIFDELRSELAIEPIAGRSVLIHGVVTSGRVPLLRISRLEVGREVWADARFASLPGNTAIDTGIDGILGVDFLRRYAVGFSTRDRVIRLYPPDLVGRRSYRGWASIPLEPEYIGESGAALYLIETRLGEHQIPAVFDLGAGLNMINRAAAESIGLTPAYSRDRDLVIGAIESTPVVAWVRVDEVTTGRIRWRNEMFAIAELGILATMTRADGPCAILGSGLFNQRDFIIDFVRNRLLVKVAMEEVDEPIPLQLQGQLKQPGHGTPVSCAR